jgi:hypothetical protein
MSAVAAAVRRKYPATISQADAAGILLHGTWGYSTAQVNSVVAQGRYAYEAWIDNQLTAPAYDWIGSRLAYAAEENGVEGTSPSEQVSSIMFWRAQQAMGTNDALRARAIFCMVKLFPIHLDNVFGIYGWFGQVEPHLFGTFRNLLEGASMNYSMAKWLTFLVNPKAAGGSQPDENFAREIMQLFSIGLWELRQDGTRKLSGELDPGDPRYVEGGTDEVPTYNLADVRGLARVFTGWNTANRAGSAFTEELDGLFGSAVNTPLVSIPAFHEDGPKEFLNITIPANTDGPTSLSLALDRIARHPSCGPFICKKMIQMMTTSNPSPGYVARVVAAWNNSIDGDLSAMWKAILLDQEARSRDRFNNGDWGKVVEPWAYVARASFPYNPTRTGRALGTWAQAININRPLGRAIGGGTLPVTPPSVFGFFQYEYAADPLLRLEGFVSPELSFMGDTVMPTVTNLIAGALTRGAVGDQDTSQEVAVDFSELIALPDDQAVADRINLLFCAGQLSQATLDFAISRVAILQSDVGEFTRARAVEALVRHLMTHPQALAQK